MSYVHVLQNKYVELVVSVLLSTAPPTVRIVHSGQACNVEEERYSERVYTIREGETLELQCLVTGHPRPQVTTHTSSPLTLQSTYTNKKNSHHPRRRAVSARAPAELSCSDAFVFHK